jgi:hypothetical protein
VQQAVRAEAGGAHVRVTLLRIIRKHIHVIVRENELTGLTPPPKDRTVRKDHEWKRNQTEPIAPRVEGEPPLAAPNPDILQDALCNGFDGQMNASVCLNHRAPGVRLQHPKYHTSQIDDRRVRAIWPVRPHEVAVDQNQHYQHAVLHLLRGVALQGDLRNGDLNGNLISQNRTNL